MLCFTRCCDTRYRGRCQHLPILCIHDVTTTSCFTRYRVLHDIVFSLTTMLYLMFNRPFLPCMLKLVRWHTMTCKKLQSSCYHKATISAPSDLFAVLGCTRSRGNRSRSSGCLDRRGAWGRCQTGDRGTDVVVIVIIQTLNEHDPVCSGTCLLKKKSLNKSRMIRQMSAMTSYHTSLRMSGMIALGGWLTKQSEPLLLARFMPTHDTSSRAMTSFDSRAYASLWHKL